MTASHRALHSAAAEAVLAECRPIGKVFAAAGYRLYLVGGSVRDLIDGRPIDEPDFDFTTDALPKATKELIAPLADALWTQGERFGTIAAHVGGRLVEITTHRAEAYEPDTRKPTVSFSDDVRIDLGRRDFTINALAIEVTTPSPELIDPYGGVSDLTMRRLATPLSPQESFSDDPLRMMRAARFVARFALTADRDLVEAVREMAARLAVVSAERIRDEFDKLLSLPDPTSGLRFLCDNGLSGQFLPELSATIIDAVDWPALSGDPQLRLATVFAAARAGGHTPDVAARLRALRSSRHTIAHLVAVTDAVGRLCEHAGRWDDASVRRFVHRRFELVDSVVAVAAAIGCREQANRLAAAVAALGAREDLSTLSVPIGGREVMDALGAEAGPLIGDAMDALLAHRLVVGPLSRDEAIAFVNDWATRRDRRP
ncbi:MAG: CCA tRNA nucleotidyltransferase [Actinobacteria bacterium]|nr:CCA tRNA nucleotidyltransferase [Actinomycetota bacterium]